jgi:Uma2 family endonuclease
MMPSKVINQEEPRMAFPARKFVDHFTYAQYLTWPQGERWELIHGVAYDMRPAPGSAHQHVLGELFAEFRNFLHDHPCQAFLAPFDVRLPEGEETDAKLDTVVQPDLSIICDPAKIDRQGCKGVPDLIIEVLSPYTEKKDRLEKFALYEQHGVKEYWLVHPLERFVEIYRLNATGTYGRPELYNSDESIAVKLFPGLTIDLNIIFGNELPPEPIEHRKERRI